MHKSWSRGAGKQTLTASPPYDISRTLKRMGIQHQVKRGKLFTAPTGRNLRMGIVVRRGCLRDARTHRKYTDKPILLDVTHVDPPKCRHTCDEVVLIVMGLLPPPPRRASANTTLVRDMRPSTNGVTNLPV